MGAYEEVKTLTVMLLVLLGHGFNLTGADPGFDQGGPRS